VDPSKLLSSLCLVTPTVMTVVVLGWELRMGRPCGKCFALRGPCRAHGSGSLREWLGVEQS
jgi:hypothetical protein